MQQLYLSCKYTPSERFYYALNPREAPSVQRWGLHLTRDEQAPALSLGLYLYALAGSLPDCVAFGIGTLQTSDTWNGNTTTLHVDESVTSEFSKYPQERLRLDIQA